MRITVSVWVVTLALIGGLLALDWLRMARDPRPVTLRSATYWSAFYVAVALLFGVGFGLTAGWDLGIQYFAGYVVEKSRSLDNLFVFVIIIGAFAVPAEQQPKALTIGILISLALRAVLVVVGAELLNSFSIMFALFGAALIGTAIQLYRHRREEPRLEDNPIIRFTRRRLPISEHYDGSHLASRADGRLVLTPLFVALVAIGSTDLLFAFDSIPAVFGVSRHAFVVFAANAFALLGLRPLYFLISALLRRLVYLSTGIAAVLGFIGGKLILESAHEQWHAIPEISTVVSLAVIASILLCTASASALRSRRDPSIQAHAGALRGHHRNRSTERELGSRTSHPRLIDAPDTTKTGPGSRRTQARESGASVANDQARPTSAPIGALEAAANGERRPHDALGPAGPRPGSNVT